MKNKVYFLTILYVLNNVFLFAQSITHAGATQDSVNELIINTLQVESTAMLALNASKSGGSDFSEFRTKSTDNSTYNNTLFSETIAWNEMSKDDLTNDSVIFCLKGLPKFGSFIDSRDGKTYKTVTIGNQTIITENLAYKPDVGKYWAYRDNESNVAKYGYLYNFETAKNVCPSGWHLPTKEEFETLFNNFEKPYKELIDGGNSGFAALLGGYRYVSGGFDDHGANAYFWSSTPYDDGKAYYMYMGSFDSNAYLYNYFSKICGFSVRCFRD